jgi:hypothetical protein
MLPVTQEYTVLRDWIIVNNELERIGNEAMSARGGSGTETVTT